MHGECDIFVMNFLMCRFVCHRILERLYYAFKGKAYVTVNLLCFMDLLSGVDTVYKRIKHLRSDQTCFKYTSTQKYVYPLGEFPKFYNYTRGKVDINYIH